MVKLSLYRRLREVEAPTFSDIRLTDGGKVVSLASRRFLLPGRFLVLISVRGWVDSRAIVRLEGLGKLKKFTSYVTRTGDLPACTIVPEPTTLPRASVQLALLIEPLPEKNTNTNDIHVETSRRINSRNTNVSILKHIIPSTFLFWRAG
jgi:hypothetical protein